MKIKYKALIADFDNTLVGTDLKVSETLSLAIKGLLERGYIFSLATGRRYAGTIASICKELNLTSPIITCGGAEIVNPQTQKALWGKYIPDNQARQIISYLYRQNVFVGYYQKNVVYTTHGRAIPGFEKNAIYKPHDLTSMKNIPIIVVPPSVSKFSEQQIETLISTLSTKFPGINVVKIKDKHYFGIDITSANTTKYLALLELMMMLRLERESVVGVGDNYNDFPLLTACGVKVAMSDAPESLKNMADFVAPSEKDDGLVEVIDKYFK